ncbi:hypothetical protein ONZ45_g13560 [Pleurotus djamor]|nr:hypothetical protein ONZ45_g13560 [Pleurotus djamor]
MLSPYTDAKSSSIPRQPDSLPYSGKYPMGKKDKALADAACKVGWYRFAEVDKYVLAGHKLYRASCPGYTGADSSQKMTAQRAAFLTTKKIDSILSFNEHSYTSAELAILKAAKINYKHVEVKDFGVASDKDYDAAWHFFKSNKSTLVHCVVLDQRRVSG